MVYKSEEVLWFYSGRNLNADGYKTAAHTSSFKLQYKTCDHDKSDLKKASTMLSVHLQKVFKLF